MMKNFIFKLFFITTVSAFYAAAAPWYFSKESKNFSLFEKYILFDDGYLNLLENKDKSFTLLSSLPSDKKIVCSIEESARPLFLFADENQAFIGQYENESFTFINLKGSKEFSQKLLSKNYKVDSFLTDAFYFYFVCSNKDEVLTCTFDRNNYSLISFDSLVDCKLLNEKSLIEKVNLKKINSHYLTEVFIKKENLKEHLIFEGSEILYKKTYEGKSFICDGENEIFICSAFDKKLHIDLLYKDEKDKKSEGDFFIEGELCELSFYDGYFFAKVKSEFNLENKEKIIAFNKNNFFILAEGKECTFLLAEEGCKTISFTDNELSLAFWEKNLGNTFIKTKKEFLHTNESYFLTKYRDKCLFIDTYERKLVFFKSDILNSQDIFSQKEAFFSCKKEILNKVTDEVLNGEKKFNFIFESNENIYLWSNQYKVLSYDKKKRTLDYKAFDYIEVSKKESEKSFLFFVENNELKFEEGVFNAE